jgi:hypothetical protein
LKSNTRSVRQLGEDISPHPVFFVLQCSNFELSF